MTERTVKRTRILASGSNENRAGFMLSLLRQQLLEGRSAIVLDFEDTITPEVEKLCAELHLPTRRQGAVLNFSGWEPQKTAQYISDSLQGEPNVQPALLYRFILYLTTLYRKAGQILTMQELAECDMEQVQQAASYYGNDEIAVFMREFSAPLMNIENALRRYGAVMSRSGGVLPKNGECMVIQRLGRTPERQESMQLKALYAALAAREFPEGVACFQWGMDDKCADDLQEILARHNGAYFLFARDAMLLKENTALIDDFGTIILLRHSNPESCRLWADFMGVRDVWIPSVSQTSRSHNNRLFRSLQLPRPDNQGTLIGLPRSERTESFTKQERHKIHPSRLSALQSGKCIMIDRSSGSIEEISLL